MYRTARLRSSLISIIFIVVCALGAGSALGIEHITLRRDGQNINVEGRLEVEAQDGGLMIMARDGVIWTIEPNELVAHTTDDKPFVPLSREEMTEKILAELPSDFNVLHIPSNYLVFYNTSKDYARWNRSLFERLYRAFNNFWKRKGFELRDPEFPLVAIVFADKASYVNFAKAELGDAASSIVGYYSLQTNRIVMYDLTGGGASGMAAINNYFSRPVLAQTTATIVHEATHQIAFNCGLHARYSDCPLWFSEGVALFFETPDLKSQKGWRTIGALNAPRLAQFVSYRSRRPGDSLSTLLADDSRLRKSDTSLDAYAEAWALTYFLLRQRPKQYVEYLKLLSAKKPLIWDTPQERTRQAEQIFGDLDDLDREFLRYMNRVRF